MRLCIIGLGNVGSHLAIAFYQSGLHNLLAYNRTAEGLELLNQQLPASTLTTDWQAVNDFAADIYLLAVKDDVIEPLSAQLYIPSTSVVAHTAGTTPMTVLSAHEHYGSFYPLQTFRREQPTPPFNSFPVFVGGNTAHAQQQLWKLAHFLTSAPQLLTDEQRQALHLAAVMVNNFTNHLCTFAADFLNFHQLSFDLLQPLLRETLEKLTSFPPQQTQTGPAVRRDEVTMERHLALLNNQPEVYTELYKLFSRNIQQYHHF